MCWAGRGTVNDLRRAYRDMLAYSRHLRCCAGYLNRMPCSCGLELAYRKMERALGMPVYPKSYLPSATRPRVLTDSIH